MHGFRSTLFNGILKWNVSITHRDYSKKTSLLSTKDIFVKCVRQYVNNIKPSFDVTITFYLLFVKIKEKLSFSIINNNMMIILYMGRGLD